MAAYKEKEDLIAIGAYQHGTDPTVDAAIALRPQIDRFLRQHVDDATTAAEADRLLLDIAARVGEYAGVGPEPTIVPDPVPAGVGAAADGSDSGDPAIPGPLTL